MSFFGVKQPVRLRAMLVRWFALALASLAALAIPHLKAQDSKEDKRQEGAPAATAKEPQTLVKDPPALGVPLPVAVDPKNFVLGPQDVVGIRVWREPELTGPYQIRPDGKIAMPLIGEIQAAGLTPDQLKTALTQALSEKIINPEVIVSVLSIQSKKYYITGEVGRSGAYPLYGPITVLEALSQAGGLREFADKKGIVIMRGRQRLKFNYKDVVKGKKLEQNIYLEDGDHIIVP